MLDCFNPNLRKIWTNPNVGLKMQLKNIQLKVKVEVTFLTQHFTKIKTCSEKGLNYMFCKG